MLIDVHTHLWETCVEESKQGILSMCETFDTTKYMFPVYIPIARTKRRSHV